MAKQAKNDQSKVNTLPNDKEAKNEKKTTKKRGNPNILDIGKRIGQDRPQPTPEAKRLGWQKIREKRMLTASIIDHMFGGDGEPKQAFHDYMKHLMAHAKDGHQLAMKTVNNAIEQEITAVTFTDTEGNALPPVVINAIQPK